MAFITILLITRVMENEGPYLIRCGRSVVFQQWRSNSHGIKWEALLWWLVVIIFHRRQFVYAPVTSASHWERPSDCNFLTEWEQCHGAIHEGKSIVSSCSIEHLFVRRLNHECVFDSIKGINFLECCSYNFFLWTKLIFITLF